MAQEKKKVMASDHENYSTFTLIGFLIPLVGFIMGAIFLTKDTKLERKLGEHLVVVGILSIILFGILWSVYVSYMGTNSIEYINL